MRGVVSTDMIHLECSRTQIIRLCDYGEQMVSLDSFLSFFLYERSAREGKKELPNGKYPGSVYSCFSFLSKKVSFLSRWCKSVTSFVLSFVLQYNGSLSFSLVASRHPVLQLLANLGVGAEATKPRLGPRGTVQPMTRHV